MDVGKETGRVGLDLSEGEAGRSVGCIASSVREGVAIRARPDLELTSVDHDTGQEGSLETTERGPSTLLVQGRVDGGVRESDPGRTSSTEGGLVLRTERSGVGSASAAGCTSMILDSRCG